MRHVFDAKQVLAHSRANQARSWMFGLPGTSAKKRLRAGGPIHLTHAPKFRLDTTWPIFTVGSCFARRIENALISRKLPVLLRDHGTPAEAFGTWDEDAGEGGGVEEGDLSRASLNKYSVHSMAHELRRCLLDEQYPNEGLIELAHDKWFDPHASKLELAPYDVALANRHGIRTAMEQIKRAKVVIMTLGLTETWIDTATGLAINELPGAKWLYRMPDRWKFIDYGFEDTLQTLVTLLHLIRARCAVDMRFIVTVSPVPLRATAKVQDVIVANSGSKCILRAVADELFRRFDFVDYYPSYEYVMYSPRDLAWKEDQLHVQHELVEYITNQFVERYYREAGSPAIQPNLPPRREPVLAFP